MRKLLLAGLVAGSLIVGAGTALGHSYNGSSEGHEEAALACPGPGQPVPANQEPPGPGECGENATTYSGWVYDNDVHCSEGSPASAEGIVVVADGSQEDEAAEAEVCNEGDTGPVQGRVLVGGSFDEGGVHATADGDKNNAPEGQGWATASVTEAGPSTRCGDDAGNRDSSHPTAADTSDDCPAPPAP